jgi:hypothetical protein
MKPSTIRKAIQEAQDFIAQAKKVLDTAVQRQAQNNDGFFRKKYVELPRGDRLTGTLRRRSHDVSEAMIALRQDQEWSD